LVGGTGIEPVASTV